MLPAWAALPASAVLPKRVACPVSAAPPAVAEVVRAARPLSGAAPGHIRSGSYWQVGDVTVGGSSANVTVNTSQTFQTWHGFGGTFNEKGWWALSALSEADRQLAIRLLFDRNDGAGFSWGRIPIGASDYAYADNGANPRYTLNDSAGDLAMNNFSIARDRQRLIPYIKAAQVVKGDIKFWGSPWTPPPWMKSNNAYDRGLMKSDAANLTAYGLYFVKWIQAYQAEGIPIDHVQPQNEPGYAQDYPSCAWGPSSDNASPAPFLGDFVEDYLAPAIQSAGLGTKIWYGTFSNPSFFSQYWNNLSGTGRTLVAGAGLQWGQVENVGTAVQTGLLVMQSEHKCGNYPWLTARATSAQDANRDNFLPSSAPNNHAYGEESWDLIKQWIEAGVHVYSAWNMVLDSEGFSLDTVRRWPQNALLTVNMNARTLTATPAYYVFRHVAQYVEPGAVRVGTQGGNALAFRNPDGSIVTVLFNSGQQAANTTLSVGGTMVQFSIPARGWATVNWQG